MNRMTRNWRRYLTPAEAKEIKRLEAKIERLSEDAAIARMKRNKIQNRATARARGDK